MNIQQIKSAIATSLGIQLPNLVMVRQLDETTKAPQPWLSHWDNDNRVRVTMHEDVFNRIKAKPEEAGLAFKKSIVEATPERAAYTRVVVITPENIEATF